MGFKQYTQEHQRKMREGLLCAKCGAHPPQKGLTLCLKCNEYLKKYQKTSKHKKASNMWRNKDKIKNPEKWKKSQLERDLHRHYGLTIDSFNELNRIQNGVCAICFCSQKGRLTVDHDHHNGNIRGLLCHKCNQVLGLLSESIDRAYSLINYLKKSQQEQPA